MLQAVTSSAAAVAERHWHTRVSLDGKLLALASYSVQQQTRWLSLHHAAASNSELSEKHFFFFDSLGLALPGLEVLSRPPTPLEKRTAYCVRFVRQALKQFFLIIATSRCNKCSRVNLK